MLARIRGLAGWPRWALAAGLGVAATGALPPFHWIPLVFVAFTGLVWLLEGAGETPRPARAGFIDGWWFGVGHFLTGLYWLAHALLIDAAQFGWMVPFATFGLSGLLAVFTGGAAACVCAARLRGVAAVLLLAVGWTAGEWLRGHVLTGFPWNLIGTVWAGWPALMQPAALVGLYGLSLLTVLVAALPAASASARGAARGSGLFAAAVLVLAGWAAGHARLPEQPQLTDVRLRLVQPNVPQNLKWDPAERESNLRKVLQLSSAPGLDTRTLTIWPETAVPFAITDANPNGPALRDLLSAAAPPGGLLLTGAPRAERDAQSRLALWNSLHALDPQARIVATYDKFHLVPFGEYVPLRSLLGTLNLNVGTVDFVAGPGLQTLALPGLPPASPLICYEAIFPGNVVASEARPGWLLNVTNDAWFGISSGPHQHFAAARFRAVEEGLPLVRAANNGISAIVDAYGRVTAVLELGETGIVDGALPAPLEVTLYGRFGDTMAGLLGLMVLAGAFSSRRFFQA